MIALLFQLDPLALLAAMSVYAFGFVVWVERQTTAKETP